LRLILPILVLIASTVAAVREIAVWRSGMLAQQRTPDRLRAALAYAPEDATIWRLLGIALLQSDADAAQNAFAARLPRTATKLTP
jgi:cytochrome c-type biogenesis protein CcmH/NrfG